MSGTRTRDNHIHRELAPGNGLGDLLGVRVEEFGRTAAAGAKGLFQAPSKAMGFGDDAGKGESTSASRRYTLRFGNQEFEAAHLYEKLQLSDGTSPLATWSNRFLDGEAAITEREIGQGRAIYIATYPSPDLAAQIVDNLVARTDVAPIVDGMPEGVEVCERRAADGRRLLFFMNTRDGAVDVSLPDGQNLVGGDGTTLEPYEVRVLKL